MKIADTIDSFRGFTNTPAEAVRMYEGTGFKHLDFNFYRVLTTPGHPLMGDNWKDEILEAKEAADRLGIDFIQCHGPYCTVAGEDMERNLFGVRRSIAACGILGIKNMVIHSGHFTEIPYKGGHEAYYEANAPFFRALIPDMEEYGVSILFENNTRLWYGDCCFLQTAKDLNEFVERMDHPLFGAAWDIGHAHIDGLDQYAEIMALGKNLKALHIQDNNGSGDQHIAPFLGTLNFDSLIRGLIDSGYEGYFTFESNYFFRHDRKTVGEPGILTTPPLSVKRGAVSLLYKIGKYMLEQYGIFEE